MEVQLNKVLQEMAKDILIVMQEIMDANRLKDSNIRKQLYTKVEQEGDDVVLKLFANHYIYWLDQGRNPTKYPPLTRWSDPVGDISDWCRRKGIPSDNRTVWAIIKKIHRFGYKGRFFLEDFWREAEQKTYTNLDILADTILKEITDWFNK